MNWIAAEPSLFTGVYQHQLDVKGRTALPAAFRDVLLAKGTDKLVITTDLMEGCLQAYEPSVWEAFARKAAALNTMRPNVRRLMRLMIAPAQTCPFDKVGRILLPPPLREHAGLTEEVVWAGSVDRIELWTPAAWKRTVDDARSPENQAALAEELAALFQ
jgi:MraZ protein